MLLGIAFFNELGLHANLVFDVSEETVPNQRYGTNIDDAEARRYVGKVDGLCGRPQSPIELKHFK